MKAQPHLTEMQIQSAVMDHWRLRGVVGSLIAAIPNANAHGQPGLTRGLPDLIVIGGSLNGRTGYLELKTHGGEIGKYQAAILRVMEQANVPCAVTYGLDQALAQLEAWGVLLPERRAAA